MKIRQAIEIKSVTNNHHLKISRALNYGAIGSIIGHEMTHGFDVNGRKFDSEGNLKQWWTNETVAEYTKKVECYEKQYSAIHEPAVRQNIILIDFLQMILPFFQIDQQKRQWPNNTW